MSRINQTQFFARPAIDTAKDLLGKIICRKTESGVIKRLRILETEAYAGDCPYVFKETQFYSIGECIAHENMLIITCFSKESPDNVVIMSVDGYSGSKAVAKILDIVSGEVYPHDILWLEDDGALVEYVAGERSFLPDGDLVNFKIKESI